MAGNVRELRNTVNRAVLFCEKGPVDEADIQFAGHGKGGRQTVKAGPLPGFHLTKSNPDDIRAVLLEHHGRIAPAARAIGFSRPALYQFLKRHQIAAGSFRKGFRPAS